jgi:hypothetical protein
MIISAIKSDNLVHSSQMSLCFWVTIFRPGVDVMISIFFDFRQFLPKILAFFSKTNVMIKYFHNLALLRVKTPIFSPILLAKVFSKS